MVVGDSATLVVLVVDRIACKWEPNPDGVMWVWGALGVRVLTRSWSWCCSADGRAPPSSPLFLPLCVSFSRARSLACCRRRRRRGLCADAVSSWSSATRRLWLLLLIVLDCKWEPGLGGVVWVWGALGVRVLTRSWCFCCSVGLRAPSSSSSVALCLILSHSAARLASSSSSVSWSLWSWCRHGRRRHGDCGCCC